MTWAKRIGFWVLTNVMIMVTIGIAWTLISTFFNLPLGTSVGLMAFCLFWGMAGSFISLLASKWMAKMFHRVRVLDPQKGALNAEEKWLVDTVAALAKKAQLPKTPEVGIYDSPDVNAFATGPSKRNSLVAVSTGLLQRMTKDEAEGVLGHEVAHIANGDMVTLTLIQGIVNSIAMFFSRVLANVIASNVDEKIRGVVYFAVTIAGDILFTLFGSMIVAWFSRRREFRADQGGAQLASKTNMVNALRRLQTVYNVAPIEDEKRNSLAALKISHRQKPGLFLSLLMTHPPLEERIAALEGRIR